MEAVLIPALEKIISNVPWRKHSRLLQACKSVIAKLSVHVHSSDELSIEGAEETHSGGSSQFSMDDAQGFDKLSIKAAEICLFDGSSYFSGDEAFSILQPLVWACDSGSLKLIEPAMDAVQKLIGHGYLRGEVDSFDAASDEILVQIVQSVCKCHDIADEGIELLVLKTLLTSVSSVSFRLHGDSLVKAVKTCYNIHIGSKVVVNKAIARASLIQILVIVFERMEADSSALLVRPIIIAEHMEASERLSLDSNVTQSVQTFITKVVQGMEHATDHPYPYSITSERGDVASENEHSMSYLESSGKGMLVDIPNNAINDRKDGLLELDIGTSLGDMEVQIKNKRRKDAFLVFRALCKLSMKSPVQESTDPASLRGKTVALELLNILLENAGEVFRKNERFLGAIKQYLCLSLLKNSTSGMVDMFQASCSIFMSLLSRFRSGLKSEIGVFFPMILLKVLENVSQPDLQQKRIVLNSLQKLCLDPQILVDIFANYDCDLGASNIFKRLVNGLVKTAQGVSLGASSTLTPAQDEALKLAAMKCLVGVLRSMSDWMNKRLRLSGSQYQQKASQTNETNENGNILVNEFKESVDEPLMIETDSSNDTSEATSIKQHSAHKLDLKEGIFLFNRKPGKGIKFLLNAKKVGETPEEISNFLKNTPELDKAMIGDYLGENEELASRVMHFYVDSLNFNGMEFDEAIRALLLSFRLPRVAQKIDRILEKFAERYCKCNPKAFSSADTAYALAYSVILLNYDAHNPLAKTKMTKTDFLRNNRGIDDGKDLPEDFMGMLYNRIMKNEINMNEDHAVIQNKRPTNANKIFDLDAILNIVVRRPDEDKTYVATDAIIGHIHGQFKTKAGKQLTVFYAASDVEIIRPMIDVSWAPVLAAFSVPLDQSEDEAIISECLVSFRHAIHITAVMCMRTQRDAFLTSLAKFTLLHSAADMKQKNINCIKAIISIADEDGNYLQEAWEHILTCISRFEYLHLLGGGVHPDAAFFVAPQNESEKSRQTRKSPVLPILKRKGPSQLQHATTTARRGTYDSAGVGGHASGALVSVQMNNLVPNLNMLLDQIEDFATNNIFIGSQNLNSEAIVDFVKALCKVSLEELRSPTDLHVFSLMKIVEIAHLNMTRIRLVWAKIWKVLSEFFITVGCSQNLSIAIFAIDSLKQLSMKFLEQEELTNYKFQHEFMMPFIAVMRKNSGIEIRDLIIRCVSQMVLSRPSNMKSGWKIVFMVFSLAATDDHKSIVLLAFETIEKIVKELFPYITQSDAATFTYCVSCLIAFTNSRFNEDTSLNSIALLHFCALKLAEAEFGDTGRNKEMSRSSNSISLTFMDREDHISLWFPLLVGLSELSFDARTDICKNALGVFLGTLRSHGHLFTLGLWERVYDSVLFPIFDSGRRAMDSLSQRLEAKGIDSEQRVVSADAWHYETCSFSSELMVELFVRFYEVVNPLIGKILNQFVEYIKRPHQNLATISVSVVVRLICSAGTLFSEDRWSEVLSAFKDAAVGTLPDLIKIAEIVDLLMARQNLTKVGHFETVTELKNRLQFYQSEVKSQTEVQLVLIQAVGQIYNMHGSRLMVQHVVLLLEVLHEIATHAHKINSDAELRLKLQRLPMAAQMPDPPLLRLETESYQAYITLLQRLYSGKPDVVMGAQVDTRLVKVFEDVLNLYLKTATEPSNQMQGEVIGTNPWRLPVGSSKRKELNSRSPMVVAALKAITRRGDPSFEKYLSGFFPLLVSLISCEHVAVEVQLALSEMFSSWIGPVLFKHAC